MGFEWKFGDKLTRPTHVNRLLVSQTGGQFYIAFACDTPTFDSTKAPESADVHAYVSLPPVLVKVLRNMLMEHVAHYEARNGEIKVDVETGTTDTAEPKPPPSGGLTGSGGLN